MTTVTIEIPEGIDLEAVLNTLIEVEDTYHTNAVDMYEQNQANQLSEATGLIKRLREASKESS